MYTAEPSWFLQMLQGRFFGLLSAPTSANPQTPGTLASGTPWEVTAPCAVHSCLGTLDTCVALMCAHTLLRLHVAPVCPWWVCQRAYRAATLCNAASSLQRYFQTVSARRVLFCFKEKGGG